MAQGVFFTRKKLLWFAENERKNRIVQQFVDRKLMFKSSKVIGQTPSALAFNQLGGTYQLLFFLNEF